MIVTSSLILQIIGPVLGEHLTTALLGGDGQFETVEHVQSTLGIHEYKAHGLMGVPNTFPGHSKAYLLQYQHKRTYNKLSKQQQYIINENKE